MLRRAISALVLLLMGSGATVGVDQLILVQPLKRELGQVRADRATAQIELARLRYPVVASVVADAPESAPSRSSVPVRRVNIAAPKAQDVIPPTDRTETVEGPPTSAPRDTRLPEVPATDENRPAPVEPTPTVLPAPEPPPAAEAVIAQREPVGARKGAPTVDVSPPPPPAAEELRTPEGVPPPPQPHPPVTETTEVVPPPPVPAGEEELQEPKAPTKGQPEPGMPKLPSKTLPEPVPPASTTLGQPAPSTRATEVAPPVSTVETTVAPPQPAPTVRTQRWVVRRQREFLQPGCYGQFCIQRAGWYWINRNVLEWVDAPATPAAVVPPTTAVVTPPAPGKSPAAGAQGFYTPFGIPQGSVNLPNQVDIVAFTAEFNELRRQNGAGPVVFNPDLAARCANNNSLQVANGDCNHFWFDGIGGQNAAWSPGAIGNVLTNWFNSNQTKNGVVGGHQAIMLDKGAREFGIHRAGDYWTLTMYPSTVPVVRQQAGVFRAFRGGKQQQAPGQSLQQRPGFLKRLFGRG